jgi:hypothetical protein
MTERYPSINILGRDMLAIRKEEILDEIIHRINSVNKY